MSAPPLSVPRADRSRGTCRNDPIRPRGKDSQNRRCPRNKCESTRPCRALWRNTRKCTENKSVRFIPVGIFRVATLPWYVMLLTWVRLIFSLRVTAATRFGCAAIANGVGVFAQFHMHMAATALLTEGICSQQPDRAKEQAESTNAQVSCSQILVELYMIILTAHFCSSGFARCERVFTNVKFLHRMKEETRREVRNQRKSKSVAAVSINECVPLRWTRRKNPSSFREWRDTCPPGGPPATRRNIRTADTSEDSSAPRRHRGHTDVVHRESSDQRG